MTEYFSISGFACGIAFLNFDNNKVELINGIKIFSCFGLSAANMSQAIDSKDIIRLMPDLPNFSARE